VELLWTRVDELLGRAGDSPAPTKAADGTQTSELVALGASLGANSHALIGSHISAALVTGLSEAQIRSALKMARFVQQKAIEITAEKVVHLLPELSGSSVGAGGPSTSSGGGPSRNG
jgi:hypothetical protein